MALRYYQQDLSDQIDAAWADGARNVLAVAPTGAGKGVLLAHMLRKHPGPCVTIAHRAELVSQMSMALAREGLRHRAICPTKFISRLTAEHTAELGRDFYYCNADAAVAGVDTFVRRIGDMRPWAGSVGLWITDECHHLCGDANNGDMEKSNKWGKAILSLPNAKGLGLTATPERADGKGLGREADGFFDEMIVGPTMRQLIDEGYLTDYRILCPPSTLSLDTVTTGGNGDFVRGKLGLATRKSSVMGDVVEHYLKWAKGKRGATFVPDIETAVEVAARFNAAGVPAAAVSSKSTDSERQNAVRDLRSGKLLQLVNVDLFGEGFDLPAIEVVSMARATQSYGLYVQTFGRVLRLSAGKDRAMVIDHVGNVERHGLPDRAREWSLDRRDKRGGKSKDPDLIPGRTCLNPDCLCFYESFLPVCPECGYAPIPAKRSDPDFVEGDLCELDAETLARMRGEVALVDRTAQEVGAALRDKHVPHLGVIGGINKHLSKQEQQGYLREAMSAWGGYQKAAGRSMSEAQRRFWYTFGTDVMSAQALSRSAAELLTIRVCNDIMRLAQKGMTI